MCGGPHVLASQGLAQSCFPWVIRCRQAGHLQRADRVANHVSLFGDGEWFPVRPFVNVVRLREALCAVELSRFQHAQADIDYQELGAFQHDGDQFQFLGNSEPSACPRCSWPR